MQYYKQVTSQGRDKHHVLVNVNGKNNQTLLIFTNFSKFADWRLQEELVFSFDFI